MTTYNRTILYNILTDLHPGIVISCDTTYASIIMYSTTPQSLVPEQTIRELYPSYVQKYNLTLLRRARDIKLSPTDRYALSDYPFPNDATKQAWQAYRKALRDITKVNPNPKVDEYDNLIGITWPISPNGDTGPSPPSMLKIPSMPLPGMPLPSMPLPGMPLPGMPSGF